MSRVLLVLAVLAVLVSMVRGQCGTLPANEICSLVTITSNNMGSITVSLTYDAAPGLTSGPICSVSGLAQGLGARDGQNTFITGLNPATTNNVATYVTTTQISSIQLSFLTSGGSVVTASTGTLVGNLLAAPFATLTTVFGTGPITSAANSDSCVAAGGGDPFFSGFQGQQFFVAGEVGAVMNVLSSFNLQLNSRIVFLDNGDALMPAEQERLFLLSQIRNAADPSVPVLDHTTYWSHPGNYFGEAGVAMIDGHRLYAKPGLYKDGWATVTLDDKPLTVSDEYTVLGSGVDAITIARPSTHRIVFRTLNVEFSLINSDLFFNVEQAHLEKGWHKHAHFDGVMGRTAKPGFQWSSEMEKEVIVQSGDLFEFVAQPF